MSKLEELIERLCPDGVELFELGTLEDLSYIRLGRGEVISKQDISHYPGDYPVYSSSALNNGLFGSYGKYMFDEELITWSVDGGGKLFYRAKHRFSVTNVAGWIRVIEYERVDIKYLYYSLINSWAKLKFDYVKKAHPSVIRDVYLIPLPPLEVQQEIVRILDTFTTLEAELEAELEARKKQYNFIKNELFSREQLSYQNLGSLAINKDRMRKPITKELRKPGNYPYYGASGIVDYVEGYLFEGDYLLVSEDGANLMARTTPIAFSASGKFWVNNHVHVLEFNNYVERRFVEYYLNMTNLERYISTAAQPKLSQENLNRILIPDYTYERKVRIVAILDHFDTLVNDLSHGLPAEIAARRKQYEYYRNKLLTFKEVKHESV